MNEKKTWIERSEQAVQYYDKGFKALFQQYAARLLTPEQFMQRMQELKETAESNCRKDIIQAFDMGFKFGVQWYLDSIESNDFIVEKYNRIHGVDYYEKIFEQ